MRKLLSVLFSTLQRGVRGGLLFVAFLATTTLWAYDFQSGDLYYNITSSSEPYTVEVSDAVSSITTATIPETITYNGTTYNVTSIGGSAFYGCSSLTSITIPNSVTSIGRVAFFDCSSLTSVTIPNSVTSIGPGAFAGCTSITKTNYTGNIASWCDISFGNEFANPIYYSKNLYIDKQEVKDLVIPNTVNSIRDYTFSYCSSLTSITIPNSVTSIGGSAFSHCSSLTSITIPNSVTSIGDEAFQYCSSLTSITIPESVTSIGSSTFIGCYFLKENFINNSSLDAEANNYWDATFVDTEIDGLLIRDNTIIRCRPYVISATIPDNVTSIGDYAFSGHSSLTSVTIPNSVTSIGNRTFSGCSSLTSIIIPNSVTSIGSYAFYGCSSLTSITIPNSVTSIGSYAFSGCYRVIAITVESGNTIYDSRDNCNAIINTATNKLIAGCQNTFIPNSVTSIGNYAFYGCSSLTSVTIPNSVTSIGYHAFYGCSSLTSVTIPNSVTSIGHLAFYECSSLTSITIPNSVTSIGEWAFADCSSLSTVFWNAKYLYDENYTYWCLAYSWDSIDSVYMIDPELGIFDIGRFVEENMPFNEEEMCNDSPFNGCDGIKSFSFGENVEVIPDGLCYGLDGITSITIPESVSSIGERSFTECSSLDTIYCYSLTPPVIHDSYLTLLFDVGEHGASSRYEYMYYAPYIYDNITLCVPCQALEKYKSQEEYTIRFPNIQCFEVSSPSEPQDTTIYHPTEYATICEGDVFNWRGWLITEAGTHTGHETVKDENYTYHHIYTLELTVIPFSSDTIVVEAYDSYEWHGMVYTESGVYKYEEWCYQEILHLTIIPSEDKEYVYEYHNYLVCDADIFVDPITGSTHVISSLIPFSLTWSDTIIGTNIDTIHTVNITPIVSPEPLTEDMLYAIGAVPRLVAGEKVDIAGTTELIMAYYQMVDQHDIADVIGVEWVAGHDVVLDAEQTTHTMVLDVWAQCDYIISMEFTFPVSKKDSEPQDTTICIYHTEDVTICEGETLIWMGMEYTETGTYVYEKIVEIVEEDDYIYHYHHIYTLKLTVIPPEIVVLPEEEAYDSYEWHGEVYTESGTYFYEDYCYQEILHLTIIPSEDNQGEVVVEPSTNSVTITWQKEDDADTYIIVIKQGDKVVCTLIFDAEGNLVSVNYLPGRESNKHGIQHAGLTSDSFQYTITGLTPSTDYTYTVTATDDSDNTISSYSGEFTTHHATSVENTNSQSPTIDCQKILYEDHIYILRDGKIYTIMGTEVK